MPPEQSNSNPTGFNLRLVPNLTRGGRRLGLLSKNGTRHYNPNFKQNCYAQLFENSDIGERNTVGFLLLEADS